MAKKKNILAVHTQPRALLESGLQRGWVCPTPWAFLLRGSLEGVGSPICRVFLPSLKKPAQSAFVKVMFPPIFRFLENHAQMGLPHTVGILAAGVPRRGRKSYLPSFFSEFEKARPVGFRKGNVSPNFQISRKSLLRWVCPTPWAFLRLGSRDGVGSPICRFFFEFEKLVPSVFVKLMFPPTFRFLAPVTRHAHTQPNTREGMRLSRLGIPYVHTKTAFHGKNASHSYEFRGYI